MKILVVATKSPWPPCDGGRLVLWLTLQALASAGHELSLVAPVEHAADAQCIAALGRVCRPHLVVARRRSWWRALAGALIRRHAVSVERHRLHAVERAVAHCIDDWHPQLVHVEQLQALANCAAARRQAIPVVLRMQNVESSLWFQVARQRRMAWPLRVEAHRLCRDESRALGIATRLVTLTERDALQLRANATTPSRIGAIAPPFPARLPCAAALQGDPVIVVSGSSGWWPNRDGTRWFVDAVTPVLAQALPGARTHVYGGAPIRRPWVVHHASPEDAIDAFPQGAIVAIALHVASGIRMRILEAWARGLPVVATSMAAAGLQVESGRELLLADSAAQFVRAIGDLRDDAALRARLVAGGRAYLLRRHDGIATTARLLDEYALALCADNA